jgi:hypothetical protein
MRCLLLSAAVIAGVVGKLDTCRGNPLMPGLVSANVDTAGYRGRLAAPVLAPRYPAPYAYYPPAGYYAPVVRHYTARSYYARTEWRLSHRW